MVGKVDKGTPIPQKLEEARREGSIETDVAWIKKSLETGHLCHNEQRLSALEKGRTFSRGLAVSAIVCAIGLMATALVNCQQQTERDAETRVIVRTNAQHIGELKSSVSEINKARIADLQAIKRVVQANGGRQPESLDCAKLDARTKRTLTRQLGRNPCEE